VSVLQEWFAEERAAGRSESAAVAAVAQRIGEPEGRVRALLRAAGEHLGEMEANPHGGKREQDLATESCSAPDVAPNMRAEATSPVAVDDLQGRIELHYRERRAKGDRHEDAVINVACQFALRARDIKPRLRGVREELRGGRQ